MKTTALVTTCLAGLALALPHAGHAQLELPVDITEVVAAPDAVAAFTETVPVTAGEFTLTITDFGVAGTPVAPADTLRVFAIDSDGNLAFDETAAGASTVTLSDGALELVVLATPDAAAAAASIGVELLASGASTPTFSAVEAFTASEPATNPSSDAVQFTAATAGDYTLSLDDLAFPVAVTDVQGLVLDGPGGSVLGVILPGAPLDVTLAAGDAPEVTVITTRVDDAARSTVRFRAVDESGAVAAESVLEQGDFTEVATLDVTGLIAGEAATLRITDFAFPTAVPGLVAQFRDAAGNVTSGTVGAAVPFTPEAATGVAYVAADPGTTAAVGVRIDTAGTTPVDTLVSLEPTPDVNAVALVEEQFTVADAGDVTLEVRDFAFPGQFDSVVAAVIRDNTIVAELQAAGVVTFAATPGTYQLSVVGSAASGAANGTLGVSVTDAAGAALLETDAVAGGVLRRYQIEMADADRVRVSISDLGVPADFDALNVTATRGASVVGQLLGGGSFDATLEAGTYTLNVVATPDATTGYGTFRATAVALPEPPAISLSTSVSSVAAGGSVTLTWDAQRATGCTASGAWSGARDVSGSETVSNLQSDSQFRLDCTGDGGSVSASASVSIQAAAAVSGGGAIAPAWLAVLGIMMLARRRLA